MEQEGASGTDQSQSQAGDAVNSAAIMRSLVTQQQAFMERLLAQQQQMFSNAITSALTSQAKKDEAQTKAILQMQEKSEVIHQQHLQLLKEMSTAQTGEPRSQGERDAAGAGNATSKIVLNMDVSKPPASCTPPK